MRIKMKILIPTVALAFLVAAAILVSDIFLFSGFVDTSTYDRVLSGAKVAAHHLEDLEAKAASVSLGIAENREVADALAAEDRAELLAQASQIQAAAGAEFCTITDARGVVVLRTHQPETHGDSIAAQFTIQAALAGESVTAIEEGSVISLGVRSARPITDEQGRVVGTVSVGYRLDTEGYVDAVKDISGCEATVFLGEERISTTVLDERGARALGTTANGTISERVLSGTAYTGEANVLGRHMAAHYAPLTGTDGRVIGMLFTGMYEDETDSIILAFIQSGSMIALIFMAIFFALFLMITKRIVTPIQTMTKAATVLALGDTDVNIRVNTKDEMRTLADAFNSMIENTRQQVKMVGDIARGELIVPVPVRSEKDLMNHALQELNETIRAQAAAIREDHERTELMLDATPLASRLWNRNYELIECNKAAVDLFALDSKQSYIERYFELCPEVQPDGQPSREKVRRMVDETFEKGACTYEYNYQMPGGEPIPCEVTMVRVPYGDDYVVAAYSRDLRQQKKMMAEIGHRDELLEVSRRVSFLLFDTAEGAGLEAVLVESMGLLGGCVDADQAYITQNETVGGVPYFTCKSAWSREGAGQSPSMLPGARFPWGLNEDWDKRFRRGECMNGPVQTLPEAIQGFFAPFQAISVLVIPVFVQERFWGLVGFSDCRRARFFGEDEVNILRSVSLMMAAAVNRNAQAEYIREVHNRIRLLTNATPLAFNLWNEEYQNIETNDTAVRLFGLASQQEYLERFFSLSPARQPDGQPSKEGVHRRLAAAFKEGYSQFEWMHQMPDGTPVPSEVTLVRLSYGGGYVVAGYIRDLREQKRILAAIEQRDHLRTVVNKTADRLLRAEPDDFAQVLYHCMGGMAAAIGADCMYLVKNSQKDGKLYRAQLYEWPERKGKAQNADLTVHIAHGTGTPEVKEALLRGESVNVLVRDMTPADRERLGAQGILAVLLIPIFVREGFWGFVGFNNCHSEQLFKKSEESIMRSGSLLAANGILRNENMARIKDTSARLERALADAEEANNAKSDFLAHMSHEIRTPLNAVVGLSELVLDNDGMDEETAEKLETIHDSGMTILSIVNDILDISKIESGKFELAPVRYDIPSLINDTVTLNAVRIGEKAIAFKVDVDENLPGSLYGDDLRVKQIFNNLLSNAFKYTHAGSVEWRISFEREAEHVWLVSSVKDTGIGIKPEDMQKLFSAYNQVDAKTNRTVEGTGLGLMITRRLVEMMDGTITAQSEYGKGSVFRVRLRQTLVSDEAIGAEVAKNLMDMRYTLFKRSRNVKRTRVNLSYAHVLVVDDIATNLDVVKGMLRPYSLKVDCAASGPQAIEMIQAGTPRYSAVFMDHMMPGMDGIEATRIIREEIGTAYAQNIPVIALTANAIVGNEEMFLHHGFQAFISKPIDMAKLDFVLRRWVRDKDIEKMLWSEGKNPRLPSEEGGLGAANMQIDGVDTAQAFERFGGDEGIFLDVLRSYAAGTPPLLDDLRAHLEAGNWEEYAIVVHGIKGSSYGICARKAGKAAEALEAAAKAGNAQAVQKGHPAFETMMRELLGGMQRRLEELEAETGKPAAEEPSPALLQELREACGTFAMDRADAVMERLESFHYRHGGALVGWLRAQMNDMAFEKIAEGAWPFTPSAQSGGPGLPPGGGAGFTAPDASVLIADDNETNLKAIAGMLEPLQMRLDTAKNGEEALRMMRQKRYHLVLMDHRMPGMDGLQATRALRQMEADYYKKVPVVALTADEDAGDAEEFLQAGMNDVVKKPIHMQTLCAVIARWLPKRMLRRTGEKADGQLARARREGAWEELPAIAGIDSAAGVQNSGSEKLFVSLLGNFYGLIDRKAAHMEEGLAQGRLRDVATEAHALKGAARMIGAQALSEEFARLERYGAQEDAAALAREMPGILRQYRSFKPLLEPYGRAAQEQKPASPQKWASLLRKLISELDRFDQDGADETFGQMEKLRAPPGCREEIKTLRACMADVAAEEAMKTAQAMLEKMKNP